METVVISSKVGMILKSSKSLFGLKRARNECTFGPLWRSGASAFSTLALMPPSEAHLTKIHLTHGVCANSSPEIEFSGR